MDVDRRCLFFFFFKYQAIRDAKALLSSKEAAAKNRNRPRLHYAIKQGDMNTVQEVVKNDPNCVNAPDRKGHTALHAAVKRRDQDLAKYLIAQGTSCDLIVPPLLNASLSRSKCKGSCN